VIRQANPKFRRWALCALLVLSLCAAIGLWGWCRWVYTQIERYAGQDQADQFTQADRTAPASPASPAAQAFPADAIGVFGAAEYDGRPSPVYRARLDHALDLYHHGVAPLIITLGGSGGDQYNEGAVGREYLMAMGVPESDIIAETQSRDTEESARRIAVIARANGLRRLVIVSDGTHLFRIHEICAAEGLNVLTSPRSRVEVEGETNESAGEFERIAHEILSYTAWRMGLH
jgi:uncharacterized SAM-binding protein YcdF (DUF218 family)